jgi:hypothetical protein
MIKEALEYLAALARSSEKAPLTEKIELPFGGGDEDYDFRVVADEYGRELGEIIYPPHPEGFIVHTLSSFIEAIKTGVAGAEGDASCLVHIPNMRTVNVCSIATDKFGRRYTYLQAIYDTGTTFRFDEYYDNLSMFVIALQASFVPDDALEYLMKLASSIKAGSSVQSDDDGFSQVLTLKTGEITTASVKLKPRIFLQPIRTFTEIEPVSSEFLIRFKQNGANPPSIGLFDVDGMRYQLNTVLAIREFLVGAIDLPILA